MSQPIEKHRNDPYPLTKCPECARLELLIRITPPDDRWQYEMQIVAHRGEKWTPVQPTLVSEGRQND